MNHVSVSYSMSQPYHSGKMESGIDFTYFNSAPMPYTFFGLPPTPQSQTPHADDYKNYHANNVSITMTY